MNIQKKKTRVWKKDARWTKISLDFLMDRRTKKRANFYLDIAEVRRTLCAHSHDDFTSTTTTFNTYHHEEQEEHFKYETKRDCEIDIFK